MRVLIGCEFSEVVKEQFLLRGHDAHSCAYEEGEKGLPNHHQCDVRELLGESWDLAIFHPNCTYLCNSGVRWLHEREGRWVDMLQDAMFFRSLLKANIPKIAVENPIMHKYALAVVGRKYGQIIQPWQFGHGEVKATCLWLKNLPLLVSTDVVDGRTPRVFLESPSPDRWKNRSRTYKGIAVAMAEQWGILA